ncbi:hypothetical protein JOF41_004299 [Saccharothrix coeruleofusca]|uniref:hypothetical protein n=1 Tax=Saccharothrix coeruleofusca TaxID=33919 RepID=UPI001AE1716F|nr:hypothetical protein [Saccharothrix coeruleofusca]MBP2338121.1 hypothetical protein [Saccharothrix coeruleofusca]
MIADDELAEVIDILKSPDTYRRTTMLGVLAKDPSGDPRLLPAVEELLTDETPDLISIPLLFGEVRWLAAHALVAERRAAAVPTPVELRGVPEPLTSDELSYLVDEHGLPREGGVHGMLASFVALREHGLLPVTDLRLTVESDG